MYDELLQMTPVTITWCIFASKNRKFWTFGELQKLAISCFSVLWNFRISYYRKGEFTPTLNNFQFFFFFYLQSISRNMCSHNLRDANVQVSKKNIFRTFSLKQCAFIFSEYTPLLFPKRFWKFAKTEFLSENISGR